MQPQFRAVLYPGWYYAAWRENGSVRRQALRTKNRDVAEQTLKSFVAQYEIANRPDNITVEYVWNGYWKSLGVKPAASTMRYEGKAVLPFFGTMAADAVTEDGCRAYRAARLAAGRKDGTIWTELGRLRSALKWAEKRGLIGRAPSIERPPIQPPRDLRLTREQAKAFVEACQMPHVRLFVILAMTTGARMGALLDLTWDRVDFEGGTIDLNDPTRAQTKKGRPRVPMNATARAALSDACSGALTRYVMSGLGSPSSRSKRD